MARKKSIHLTEAELPLMNVLWARGASTVNDVLAALPNNPPLAYNTVLTTLRILEERIGTLAASCTSTSPTLWIAEAQTHQSVLRA